MTQLHLITEGLSKQYDNTNKRAVDNLSIEIPEGSITGLFGLNGAGKSTIVKMLMGLIYPTAGHGKILGLPITMSAARKEVGYMSEHPVLDRRYTPRTFLKEMGLLGGLTGSNLSARIDTVMEEVGIAPMADYSFFECSYEMQLRAELAQALLHKPKLLILDEPFEGLDLLGRRHIHKLIASYNRRYNTTVLFASHICTDAEILCDYIAILHKGKLRVIGKKDKLLTPVSHFIYGIDIDPHGIAFLQRISLQVRTEGNRTCAELSPHRDPQHALKIFETFKATSIEHTTTSTSLETYFTEVVGNE